MVAKKRRSGHAVSAGQFDKKRRVVEVGQAVLGRLGKQLLEQLRDGRLEAEFARRGEGIAHVLQLHRDRAALGEVALDHALAVHLQDAAVGEAAADGLLCLLYTSPSPRDS